MKSRVINLLVLTLLTCWTLPSSPPPCLVVIVNKNNQLESLSAAKIKVIYLRKISRWPWGAEIMPVDLSAKTALRTTFVESVLNISPHELDVYWIDQRVSRSLSPPTQVPSVKAAKALVAANPGAVAYIPQSEVDDSVRVIALR